MLAYAAMAPVAIVQARMGSTRLPGKVLERVAGKPMLGHIVERLSAAPGLAKVVVATSEAAKDEPVRALCASLGVACFSGSELDVLDRFLSAAQVHHADPVMRVTADCPFVDPELVGRVLALFQTGAYDYTAAATGGVAFYDKRPKFPDGLDVECFSFAALTTAHRDAQARSDREHVTPYLYRTGKFRVELVASDVDRGALRWTVDHPEDLELVRRVYDALYRPDRAFGMREILALVEDRPELARLNQAFVGHEGYAKVWNPDA
jgi:spore coat polysaccharide biosynthesis protein SpsF (cytidylyltransferase family)